MDIRGIMNSIPHRYPFLLVDRVLELESRKRAVAIKNVTFNEPFFPGHFPDMPVMPGVLIIEAMAQTGAVLLLHDMPDRASKLVYFTGIDNARFGARRWFPGDQLRFTLEVVKLRSRNCKMRARPRWTGSSSAQADDSVGAR